MKIYTMVQIIYGANALLKQHLNRVCLGIEYHLNNANDPNVQQLNSIGDAVIGD